MDRCPICCNKLVVTRFKTKATGTHYYCMSCELSIVDHENEKPVEKVISTKLIFATVKGA